MTPAQVQSLAVEMGEALDHVAIAYRLYVAALDKARCSAENLNAAIKDLAAHPHLELQDFEIDG